MTTNVDCPTFIDLRAAAAAAPIPAKVDADPFGSGARVLAVRAGPCTVSAVSLANGSGSVAPSSADVWFLAESGRVTLTGPDGDLLLNPGESCVVSRGAGFVWHCDAPAQLIAMAYSGGDGATTGIIAIDNQAPMAPSNPPAADLLLGDTPSCRSNNHFASADETFKCGIWDSTPYQRTPIFFHHTELMHLLAGEVSFTDAAGRSATFRKGDTFIIEQGAECSWDSQVDVAKIYAQFRPAA